MSPDIWQGRDTLSLHDFMAAANAAYYAGRDPLGARGDFITAPEISQMFGELIGLWMADLALRAGVGPSFAYVELGPGRGTLAADALRAMGQARLVPPVHLVETSPTLRARQQAAVPGAIWHDSVATLPDDRPLIVIANEFFDALPIRQFQRTGAGWRERFVQREPAAFILGGEDCGQHIPLALGDAPLGSMVERNFAAEAIVADLAERFCRQGGALLTIDYGYEGPASGDTLQAMSQHRFADPLDAPGTRDLTAHVDFGMIAAVGRAHGLRPQPCIGQGALLTTLGIDARAATLTRANPARAEDIRAARDRLVEPDQMGTLFKALALRHPDWPASAGFA
ncbi:MULTISPECIES: class I SAM-dependent methyltransferase [unclassified Sphingobium]|uniref:class I SAM-dependent methyltransferase n=1 Tax=unclassified Sphingobium TaxID=2611147 RepID=UPI0029CAAC82|nr:MULTISPECIES: SAM-dependent methyltransferase [unclassified Sphingobium]MCW2348856.1 SAM-dependent MidA family methyltransferase [Sphingobium sp. B12D2B]MCW2367984.1 SAM-dependent MidA family methyltransferase [Sphingobium sp. B11D3D]